MNDWDNVATVGYGDAFRTAMTTIINADVSTNANAAVTATVATIKGKMFKASYEIDHFTWENSDKDAIKMKMIHEIVAELIKGGAIEFTSMALPHEMKVRINARLFVTPNAEVQILRKNGF